MKSSGSNFMIKISETIIVVIVSLILNTNARAEQWPSLQSIIQDKLLEASKKQQLNTPTDPQANIYSYVQTKKQDSIDNTNYITMIYEATEYQIRRLIIKENIIEGVLKRDDFGFSKRLGKRSLWRKVRFSKIQIPLNSNNTLGSIRELPIASFQEPPAKITVDVGMFKLLKLYKNGAMDRLSEYQEAIDCTSVNKLNSELNLEINCAEALKFRLFEERVIEVWKALDQNL